VASGNHAGQGGQAGAELLRAATHSRLSWGEQDEEDNDEKK
jgi:hypothetical protein